MPSRAQRICPRCRQLYTFRCDNCATRVIDTMHKRATRTTSNKGNPYLTSQWIAFSRAFRKLHTTCECPDCLRLPEYRRPRSEIVDHIDGLGPNGPRGYDPSNLRAMTRKCHNKKTNRHDGGFGNPIRRLKPPIIS